MTVAVRQGWAPGVSDPALPAIEVALVNNMPDAAFADAERQFTGLLQAGAGGRPIAVRLFSLTTAGRSEPVRRRMAQCYEALDDLYRRPPDAVVVTGKEPRTADLRDEDVWESLSHLVRWSVESTSAAMFSCLAAHAALLELAGAERRRLPAKACGVYRQSVRPGHPLTAGLRGAACPHSRYNDVPAAAVTAAGYRVLLESPGAGWTLAAADGRCQTVLVQGHPEYWPTTLLREYRRDVGRYLSGGQATYPEVPVGYLEPAAVELLGAFRRAAEVGRLGPDDLDRFPLAARAEHVAVDWRPLME
ncbi:MAG: homoserine O-acetyltransferase/O-succinyltransferase family protein, partial [Acidimicrobiales bacterium]